MVMVRLASVFSCLSAAVFFGISCPAVRASASPSVGVQWYVSFGGGLSVVSTVAGFPNGVCDYEQVLRKCNTKAIAARKELDRATVKAAEAFFSACENGHALADLTINDLLGVGLSNLATAVQFALLASILDQDNGVLRGLPLAAKDNDEKKEQVILDIATNIYADMLAKFDEAVKLGGDPLCLNAKDVQRSFEALALRQGLDVAKKAEVDVLIEAIGECASAAKLLFYVRTAHQRLGKRMGGLEFISDSTTKVSQRAIDVAIDDWSAKGPLSGRRSGVTVGAAVGARFHFGGGIGYFGAEVGVGVAATKGSVQLTSDSSLGALIVKSPVNGRLGVGVGVLLTRAISVELSGGVCLRRTSVDASAVREPKLSPLVNNILSFVPGCPPVGDGVPRLERRTTVRPFGRVKVAANVAPGWEVSVGCMIDNASLVLGNGFYGVKVNNTTFTFEVTKLL
jgi:hypothetical protein